ncbi:class I SAM-dependent methyltransferase [Hamadaea tsunoensis]|uniref:class I SAM-dependent methyltransferase n=1 Tax=Hamadaea tsunoensis TaxID=53368 RepID=UPI0007E8C25D|nr:class I SAM-dependent methyltransferase [Hamadaea tsunoensis]
MDTPELRPEIRAYYERGGERTRLRQGVGRLEFLRTRDVLRRVLPEPPGRLLDVGGGDGVHAEWLAADGWQVRLIDPVPDHVAAAARIPGIEAELGDARKLAVDDHEADVVLLLGPLYHLTEPADRARCLAEAVRAVRPGGLVVAATINRYSALHDQLNRGGWFEPDRRARLAETTATGVVAPDGHFTVAYLHQPSEIAAETAAAGLTGIRQYAVEGAAWLLGDIGDYLDDPERAQGVLDAVRLTEADPALLGVSGHLLTVGHADGGAADPRAARPPGRTRSR